LNDGLRYHDGYNTQSVLHLTWEPWSRSGASDDSYTLSHIAAGQYDDYITKFAQDCRQWQDPIRLRFAHEMISVAGSASWYPWQDKPTEYIAAWQHVRQIFRDQNATNVEFVWAPNSYPADLETLRQYYPGAENVDWLGMDGYNPGEDGLPGYPYWQNFDDLFFNLYNVMVDHPEVFGDKKIMLAEFASAELDAYGTRTKAEWIFNAFQAIKERYSEIEAFYWFNTLKEADWRIDSSADSLFAFQTVMQDPYFTSHVIPEPNMLVLFGTGLVYMVGKKKQQTGKG
jgi:PEP-CTERM putative exosortase interaction domain